MRPVLRRRNGELSAQRFHAAFQVFGVAGCAVIVDQNIARQALARVGPLGVGVLRGESAQQHGGPGQTLQHRIGPTLLVQQQVVEQRFAFIQIGALPRDLVCSQVSRGGVDQR